MINSITNNQYFFISTNDYLSPLYILLLHASVLLWHSHHSCKLSAKTQVACIFELKTVYIVTKVPNQWGSELHFAWFFYTKGSLLCWCYLWMKLWWILLDECWQFSLHLAIFPCSTFSRTHRLHKACPSLLLITKRLHFLIKVSNVCKYSLNLLQRTKFR